MTDLFNNNSNGQDSGDRSKWPWIVGGLFLLLLLLGGGIMYAISPK